MLKWLMKSLKISICLLEYSAGWASQHFQLVELDEFSKRDGSVLCLCLYIFFFKSVNWCIVCSVIFLVNVVWFPVCVQMFCLK